MKQDLNLLPSVAKFQAAKIRLKKKIFLFMSIFLGVWVTFMVLIFIFFGVNSLLLIKAKRDNETALDKYKSLVTNVVLSKKNKYQAKIVGKVLSERFEYGSSIEKIMGIFSGDITLEDFKIKNKKQFILNGATPGSNFIKVEEMVRDINLGLDPDFKSAKLTGVSIGSFLWRFEMEVNLI